MIAFHFHCHIWSIVQPLKLAYDSAFEGLGTEFLRWLCSRIQYRGGCYADSRLTSGKSRNSQSDVEQTDPHVESSFALLSIKLNY